jgi:hypothetical protein
LPPKRKSFALIGEEKKIRLAYARSGESEADFSVQQAAAKL